MAKTLAEAQQNYANAQQFAASNYNAAKGRMAAGYAEGMQRFLGAPVAANISGKYQAKVAAATYRMGDATKWATNYRRKMTGG